ncbi:MAG TPA: aldehyde dehydrogenase family protein [Microbacteriaceae bacterium]|jgi:glyceraldehyde-3-phosphate dehydrogenase (NADP+)|nr:aldehyde dehydrogenase family protein [Microbacteriaceae bacterium]
MHTHTTNPTETPTDSGSARVRPIYVGGRWVDTGTPLEVSRPGEPGRLVAVTCCAGAEQVEEAVQAAIAAEPLLAAMPAFERANALRAIASGINAQADELARLIAEEAGKPIRDAATEVQRSALTFRIAAEEAERMSGEVIPLDVNAASTGRLGIVRRFPLGAVAGITPFNLPLSLAAHKVAPAIAAGCPIVLKPASETPLTMLAVAEILATTGLPAGTLSVLPMTVEVGDSLVTDERFKLLSFTGSPGAGWPMKHRAGKKKVVLELGGNAAAIVDASADVARAAQRCVPGAYKYAGQLCVSVQRLFVHASVWEEFTERFVEAAQALRLGDPLDEETDVGPMINRAAVERTRSWVGRAVEQGAQVLCGGEASGPYFQPTLLSGVPRSSPLCSEEAFAPVAIASPFDDFTQAIAAVNDSRFGLQAGVFTNDLAHAWQSYNQLQVGSVIVNDSPAYRVDHMPYGGVKDSGQGREGVRWAMEAMTEPRMMVMVDAQ